MKEGREGGRRDGGREEGGRRKGGRREGGRTEGGRMEGRGREGGRQTRPTKGAPIVHGDSVKVGTQSKTSQSKLFKLNSETF